MENKLGRPRSEEARAAILHAVDDLVLEIGYGAVTMKAIAERAGVSRQTLYRWWSTKAQVLLEASAIDAQQELDTPRHPDAAADIAAYLAALIAFLTVSPAGAAYRALLGDAQHDPDVRTLLSQNDILGNSAAAVIERALGPGLKIPMPRATALLIGPVFFWIVTGRNPDQLDSRQLLADFLTVAGG